MKVKLVVAICLYILASTVLAAPITKPNLQHYEKILAHASVKIDSQKYVKLNVFKKSNYNKDKDETSEFIAEAKLIDGTKILSTIQFEPINCCLAGTGYNYAVSGKFLGDKGFSGHPPLISFHFEYPACDCPIGETIIFLQNNKLYYGLTTSEVANEQIVNNYHLVFPNSKNGKANQLTVINTFKDTETGRKTSPDMRDIYIWQSNKFKHIAGSNSEN